MDNTLDGFLTRDEEMDVLNRSIVGTDEIGGLCIFILQELDTLEDEVRDNQEAVDSIEEIRKAVHDIEDECGKIVGSEE